MKFLEECKADATAHLVNRACPMHLLEPMELIKDLEKPEVISLPVECYGRVGPFSPVWRKKLAAGAGA